MKTRAKHDESLFQQDEMNIKIYIDEQAAFIACQSNRLSDGSIAYDIHFRGNPDPIPAISQAAAYHAMELFAKALEAAVGERPLVL